ncbi:LysE family translocator [Acuticoccus kandeliae]|uniref:LysE family translocator n=1 Tax=Acuticoccus kandeliae TaxID=2073160 RepID=UPI000D3EA26B|nr:LysE family translocator [Acuticoccus kandeliae]
MTGETLLLFVATEFVLSLTPGPAVLLVVATALRSGPVPALGSVCGVLATNAAYFALSALGVGALIVASATLFTIVKWVGAAYLVYLGIGMVRPLIRRLVRGPQASGADGPVPVAPISFRRAMGKGIAVQAANPKNLAFFVALLPQFVTPDGAVATQLAVLGVVSILVELPVLLAYLLLATVSWRWMRHRAILWLEGIGGGILIGLGAALAASRAR